MNVRKKVNEILRKERARDRQLLKKYPWLQCYDWHGNLVKDAIDWGWSDGWDWALGKEFMADLDKAIKLDGAEKTFRIEQVKEKWGRLVLYYSGAGENVNKVVSDYECVSEGVCMRCGSPYAQMTYTGWNFPCCQSCWEKTYNKPWDDVKKSDFIGIPTERHWRRFSKDGNIDGVSDLSYIRDRLINKWNKRIAKRQRRQSMYVGSKT